MSCPAPHYHPRCPVPASGRPMRDAGASGRSSLEPTPPLSSRPPLPYALVRNHPVYLQSRPVLLRPLGSPVRESSGEQEAGGSMSLAVLPSPPEEPPDSWSEHYWPAWTDPDRKHGCSCGAELAPAEIRAHLVDCEALQAEVARRRRVWLQRPGWMQEAACRGRDSDDFFKEETSEARNASSDLGAGMTNEVMAAKALCLRCPVRKQCRQYAWDFEARYRWLRTPDSDEEGEYRAGVWGGLTPEERSRLASHENRQRLAETHLRAQKRRWKL